jgi:hypothetical protein
MMRSVFPIAALFSLFWFPYAVTLVLSFFAGLFFPWVPLVLGIGADLLYYTSSVSSLPVASLTGAGIALLSLLVRYLLKTRIM